MVEVEVGRTASGRRAFALEFRVAFLREWDACIERGAKTRLLREHALNRTTVDRWLAARERGDWEASTLAAVERGRGRVDAKDRAELARLRAENERLQKKVAQSEAAQEILGKAFELLDGITKGSSEQEQREVPTALMSAEEYRDWLKRHRLS